jgi:hypothetical protein
MQVRTPLKALCASVVYASCKDTAVEWNSYKLVAMIDQDFTFSGTHAYGAIHLRTNQVITTMRNSRLNQAGGSGSVLVAAMCVHALEMLHPQVLDARHLLLPDQPI